MLIRAAVLGSWRVCGAIVPAANTKALSRGSGTALLVQGVVMVGVHMNGAFIGQDIGSALNGERLLKMLIESHHADGSALGHCRGCLDVEVPGLIRYSAHE